MERSRRESALEERLLPGETVVAQARIHNGIYWHAAAVLVFAVLVGWVFASELGMLLLAVSVLMALHAAVKKEILMMVVTDKRVFVRYGLLQIDVVDIHFDKIESIELEQMLPGYFIGYANVIVMGTGNRYIVIPFVANGRQLRRAYNEQVLSEK